MTRRMCALELSNGSTIEVTPEHRFFSNGEWTPIEELNVNDTLQLKDNSIVVIENKIIFPTFVEVYNLEIEDYENYYVTEEGVLVHNGYRAIDNAQEYEKQIQDNVWLSLFGIGNSSIVVCDSLKGKEINMSLKEFNEDAYNAFGSLDNYCKVALKDYEGVSENLKEHGVPDESLWNSYKERFRYDFEFNFEDKQTKPGIFLYYEYTNGEFGKLTDGYNFTMRSRPKNIAFDWNVGDVYYDAEFYFDEDEVLDVFKTAYSGNRDKKGIMVINTSKYNNRFDIYLSVNGKKYALKKTQILVYKKKPGDEARLFYDNSPKEDIRMFIGE